VIFIGVTITLTFLGLEFRQVPLDAVGADSFII